MGRRERKEGKKRKGDRQQPVTANITCVNHLDGGPVVKA